MADLIINLFVFGFLIVLGFLVGRFREHAHFKSIREREAGMTAIVVSNCKRVAHPETARGSFLVTGEAVMATDFFKSFAATLRSIIGGEVYAYERLIERARREACLRMLEAARQMGATEVWNVRYQTSNISSSSRRNPAVSVEVFAFGTAVIRATSGPA